MNISDFTVILVEPKYPGNIGAVARAMMNFDFHNLSLVNPCSLDDECYRRAMHASKLIDNAKIYDSFKKTVKDIDYLVATSSIESLNDKRHLRNSVYLEDFTDKIFDIEGKIGLVFGREDYGLLNKEIAVCDILLRIPTSNNYPSLNLSHAVGLVLYSLYIKKSFEPIHRREIDGVERNKLYESFQDMLDEINYPIHKREKTFVMFKRIMGRAMPSKWEYHSFMGIISYILNKIREK